MGDLSEHFLRYELQCRCCGRLNINARFLSALEELRKEVDQPIIIKSGYRCPNHPLSVKRPGSFHVKGQAADIWIQGLSVREMARAAEEVEAFKGGGIGLYPNQGTIHVDSRMEPTRWICRRGKYTYGNDLDSIWERVFGPSRGPQRKP